MSIPASGQQTAQILPFPPRIAPVAPTNPNAAPIALELGSRGQWCGILYVARQLRLEAVDLRTVVNHIRAHIDNSGFPAPASSRLRHGQPVTGAAAVSPKSEWLRASVDGWVAARDAGLSSATVLILSQDRAARVDADIAARLGAATAKGTGA